MMNKRGDHKAQKFVADPNSNSLQDRSIKRRQGLEVVSASEHEPVLYKAPQVCITISDK